MAIPRVTHIGSFSRPINLLEKRKLFSEKLCTAEDLRSCEDDAIRELVSFQRELGLKTITDGEFRRSSFTEGVFDNLDGLKKVLDFPIKEWKPYVPGISGKLSRGLTTFPTYICDGRIKRRDTFFVDDFKFLRTLVPSDEVRNIKITFPSPIWWYFRHGEDAYSREVYQNADEYFEDFANAYREEIQELYSLGCRQIQIDDPWLCFYCDENIRADIIQYGASPDDHVATFVRALNNCLAGKPDDLTASLHLCRSSFNEAIGPYDWLAERIFSQLNFDAFNLEYHNPALTGGFECLKHFPHNKVLVLGLVSTKAEEAEEDTKQIISKVHDAAIAISSNKRTADETIHQLRISPHCGFSPRCVPGKSGDIEARRKLTLLLDAAKSL